MCLDTGGYPPAPLAWWQYRTLSTKEVCVSLPMIYRANGTTAARPVAVVWLFRVISANASIYGQLLRLWVEYQFFTEHFLALNTLL